MSFWSWAAFEIYSDNFFEETIITWKIYTLLHYLWNHGERYSLYIWLKWQITSTYYAIQHGNIKYKASVSCDNIFSDQFACFGPIVTQKQNFLLNGVKIVKNCMSRMSEIRNCHLNHINSADGSTRVYCWFIYSEKNGVKHLISSIQIFNLICPLSWNN